MYEASKVLKSSRKAALSMSERTAVIHDPQPLWLEAVQQVLTRIGFDVVGKTTSPEVARTLVRDTRPDVVVTELAPDDEPSDGLAWLTDARDQNHELRVIVLSMQSEPRFIDAALEAGVTAYVIKTAHPDDLASAVRQAFEHSVFLAGRRAPVQLRALPSNGRGQIPSLTSRELEILRLVAEGHSNAELARMLWVTEQTVKFHLSNVYRKLNVANRTEASRWAQVHGLLAAQPVELGAA
jgi:DNA-binding NarL/FixJ family response regulator